MAIERMKERSVNSSEVDLKKEKKKEKKSRFSLPWKKEKGKEAETYDFPSHPLLSNVKPKEGYVFHSDYFEIDNGFATILSFFHVEGATDNFGPFWGINKIPTGLGDGVETILFESISKMSEGWIKNHQTRAEGVANMDSQESGRAGTSKSKRNAGRKVHDLDIVAQELIDGAAYLNAKYRLLVKARTLDDLDYAVQEISRLYVDRFGTLSAAAYAGDQRRELSDFFKKNERKLGRGFYMTSKEFAGSYSLVTHGLEDVGGEYVGHMTGDVNTSAVLFDVDNYKSRVVIANENYHETYSKQKGKSIHISDMWGSKISQSALMNNHRVVHILLDGCNMDDLGPKFHSLTHKLDMHHGAINMFEMFGKEEDELSIFPAQMQKLILMAEQAYETTDSDRSIIRSSLEQLATQFYIDQGMWYANAKEHRDRLRVVGIPHKDIPLLQTFVAYLNEAVKAEKSAAHGTDTEALHTLKILSATFQNLLSNNGDLFNTLTSDAIDGAVNGQRVIYDFGGLMRRGVGIAMAQLVNVIGFAVGSLGEGDTVIIHGADVIDDGVKDYITLQLNHLFAKRGRVVYIYNNIDTMIADKAFCKFDKADYTILGNMTDATAVNYQTVLGQDIPPDLLGLITKKGGHVCYIRRNFDNVVFDMDLVLYPGVFKKKTVNRQIFKKRKGGRNS